MAGKIQGADLKTEAELILAGADKTYLPNDTQIYITANGINKTLYAAITDQNIGAPPVAAKESLLLDSTDILNQYVDLATEALTNSIDLHVNRIKMFEGIDYSTSVVAGPLTRITFLGDFSSSGSSAIVEGDTLYVEYIEA